MTTEGKDNVIRLEYRDFEIAINAIASSIDDTAALKNTLQCFLASPKVISPLPRPQIERLLTLFPVDFAVSTPQVPKVEAPPHPVALAAKAVAEQIGDKLNKIFEDMFAAEDRRDEALKK